MHMYNIVGNVMVSYWPMPEILDYEPARDHLDGIRELTDWLNNKVATLLRRLIITRLPLRVVIQYCWRPGRWKSLT